MFYSLEDLKRWKSYIANKLKNKKISLPKELEDFLLNLEIQYLDYDEFTTVDKGRFCIFYLNGLHKGKKINIRRVEGFEYCFDRWGFVEQIPEECFDAYLRNEYHLDLKQEIWVLDTIREFFDLIK